MSKCPVGNVTATSTFDMEVGDAVTSSANWDEHSLDRDVIVLAARKFKVRKVLNKSIVINSLAVKVVNFDT